MSAPYFADHDVTLWQGDAAEVLATLPAESVNCVVTSPPYFGLRDYGVDGQIGLEPSPTEYVVALVAVFAQVKRVLRADGVVWLNLGDSYSSSSKGTGGTGRSTLGSGSGMSATNQLASQLRQQMPGRKFEMDVPAKNLMGVPWRVAFALQDDGWILRNSIIWHKPNAMPESVTDRLSSRHENVFLLSKSPRYWFDLDPIRRPLLHPDKGFKERNTTYGPEHKARRSEVRGAKADIGSNPGNVWTVTTQPFAGAHFATMPPELVRRCILAGCPDGGTVLDPFSGSGTTAMVARRLGRKAVGIELNPDYLALSVDRIGQTPLDFGAAS